MKKLVLILSLISILLLVGCNDNVLNVTNTQLQDDNDNQITKMYINEQVISAVNVFDDEKEYMDMPKQIEVNDGFITLHEVISLENVDSVESSDYNAKLMEYLNDNTEFLIQKYDENLNKIWSKRFGGHKDYISYNKILSARDAFYLFGAKTENWIDVLEKYDLDGNLIWEKTSSGENSIGEYNIYEGEHYIYNDDIICITPDNVFFIYGATGEYKKQFSFDELRENIKIINNSIIEETQFDCYGDTTCVNDNSFLFKFEYDDGFNETEILVSTDFDGNVKWIDELKGKIGFRIVDTIIPDGQYYLVLKTNAIENNHQIVKYDGDGKIIWESKNLKNSKENVAMRFTKFADKYLYVFEANDEYEKVYLLDKDGNTQYLKILKERLEKPLYNMWILGNAYFIDNSYKALIYDNTLQKYLMMKYNFSAE